ncbi:DUF3450 domain-containing protein [Vibrio cidicii]|nr:DUF3450 domain-containing protein [Vibrio cidicii]
MTFYKASAAALLMATVATAHGSDLDKAQKIQSHTNTAAAKSQTLINGSAENSQLLQAEIELLQEEVRNLEIYQRHLTSLIHSQEQEKSSLASQISEIQSTRQGIVPLMYDMLAELKGLVVNDVPLKAEQRKERVEKLELLMARADVAEAEKFRRILEAYQIELDYGNRIGAYQAQIQTVDGKARQAELLHLGRISLIARSLSGQAFWYWNQQQKQWMELTQIPASELNRAFDVANQKVAPALLYLPLSVAAKEVM